MIFYMITAECLECGEVVRHVEARDGPVYQPRRVPEPSPVRSVDQPVEITARYCPECGVESGSDSWDVYETAEIERVLTTQERIADDLERGDDS